MRDARSTLGLGAQFVDGPVEYVILVDANDRELGTAEKLAAHRSGRLHRAVSVFIVNGDGEVLLQRRATRKYHSGGRWSNTACGHPRPGESAMAAAQRRLWEEMGVECLLTAVGATTYRLAVTEELVEHELDHLFIGRWEGTPQPDPAEVSDCAWRSVADLDAALARDPATYTGWLPFVWERVRPHLGYTSASG